MKTADRFVPGDWVIFQKTKFSTHPGPRAKNIHPARLGDMYTYTVEKFWIVAEVREDGTLLLKTRTGKTNLLPGTDQRLRKPTFWERQKYRLRFEAIGKQVATDT
jgi:hypothetical protein